MWSILPKAIASIVGRFLPPANARMAAECLLAGCLCLSAAPHAAAQTSSTPQPIPLSSSPHEVAVRILHHALLQSVWGPPAYCQVRQSVFLFGKQLSGQGDYIRGGLGSGKLKFNLRMAAGDQLNTLLQISDGQRLLCVEAIGDVRRRTEVDLGKVRPRLVLTNESLRDPVIAMYLAIGGQAEAVRKIYLQYNWTSVREGQIGDVPVWRLTGKVSQQPPAVRSEAAIDNMLFTENASGLLPSRIQIAIGKPEGELPFWIYEMEQVRDADELSPLGRKASLRIVTEWANPIVFQPQELDTDVFQTPSSNEPLFDETDRYLPPLTATAQVEGSAATLR